MLAKSERNHLRALDKFVPDPNAAFVKCATGNNIPLVCGISGHTGSLMLGAKLYGDLTTDELNEYALACFSFLTAGGNHSFHEVMSVAALVGVDVGHYEISMQRLEETVSHLTKKGAKNVSII